MQQLSIHLGRPTKLLNQATCMLPGHGGSGGDVASNDASYRHEDSVFRMVVSVLANVVGGALLLSGMLILPYVFADFLR